MALIDIVVSENPDAPVIVLFGGDEVRRHEVISHISQIGDLTVYGTLSKKDGIQKIAELPKVDVVLIGGRYTKQQREAIRTQLNELQVNVKISEPGYRYEYSNAAIKKDISDKLEFWPNISHI
jgi:hypothetical protein